MDKFNVQFEFENSEDVEDRLLKIFEFLFNDAPMNNRKEPYGHTIDNGSLLSPCTPK